MSLMPLDVVVRADARGGATITWSWPGDSFQRSLTVVELTEVMDLARGATEGRSASRGRRLPIFGERLGQLAVGDANTARLLDSLDRSHERFTLVCIESDLPWVTALPWEALVLPGTTVPLLFHRRVYGWFDFARVCPTGETTAGRRAELKCLACWSLPVPGDLQVRSEVEELRDREMRHPRVRFRWVLNPSLQELRTRLGLECALFLYAGHGRLDGAAYLLELASGPVTVDALFDALVRSRVEVLVFDSCWSGLAHADAGPPSLLRRLPTATCLLGMQGRASDVISRIHMPALVESVLSGQPIWTVVNLLRMNLYEQGRDDWPLPVIHLKRCYVPFPVAGWRHAYLDALGKTAPLGREV